MSKVRWLTKRRGVKAGGNGPPAITASELGGDRPRVSGYLGHGRLRWPAVVVSAAGLAAAAVVVPIASAGVAHPPAPMVPVLGWHPCDRGFQCATARVPLDYQQPRGKTISIAVIRRRAADPAHRLGSLFFNSGGPAEQIRSFVRAYQEIPTELRARFDIVSFDPRGFGLSTQIDCFPTLAAEHKFLAGMTLFPVGHRQQREWEEIIARFDAHCAEHGGGLLAHDSTADVARDMNLLRQAIGDRVLNYLGLSYGTGLGAVYANLFPAKVGHMVLDGNLDPIAWTHGSGLLPESLRARVDVGDAQAMRAFLNLCGKATIAACAFSAGSPAATRAKFADLLHRLLHHPISIGSPPQPWTYANVITLFPGGEVLGWPPDAVVLQQLWAASAPGHQTPPGAASPGEPLPRLEQLYAVLCADSPNPGNPRDYVAAARVGYARAGGFGLLAAWQDEPCARWPRAADQDRYTGPWNRWTAHPILLIGNTVDPATPYWSSVAMSRDLARARLLTVKGYGHTEFANPSTCAINDEIRYLTTGALPPAGTVCQQNGKPFPPPSR